MVFFNKPAGGPDSVGGVFPWTQTGKMRNRSGSTLLRGEVAQMAFSAGTQSATEIATNDSNSYIPGASNDTIWNTVINPQSNAITLPRAGVLTGAFVCVALEDVADDAIGEFQFFGICNAFVNDAASGDGAVPGQLLGVSVTSNAFRCHIVSNSLAPAFYIDAQDATLTNRALKRVFLTQGLGGVFATALIT